MNDEQVMRAVEYFKQCWPTSRAWPDEQFDGLTDTFLSHGASYVRRAFGELLHDREFRVFPPGVAAFIQALDAAEANERQRIADIDRRLRWDADAIRMAEEDIAHGITPSNDPAEVRARMDQGEATRQSYVDRLAQ